MSTPEVHGALDVHDPNPPDWAIMPAEDVLRQATEPDNGGVLRWRRRTAATPVVRIEDRYLIGRLTLRAQDFPYLLEFVRCRFEQPPDFRQANLSGLEFNGCWLPGLAARNTSSDNDIALLDSTVDGGSVDLTDARVRGSLVLSRSRLHNPNRRALHADRLDLAGALLATNIDVRGEIRIPGLRCTGNVNLSGAVLHNPSGAALDGNGMHIGGNLVCATEPVSGNRFRSVGWVFLPSATVDSDFSMRGALLQPATESGATMPVDDPSYDGRATLIADRIKVDGNTDLDEEFASTGTVRMVNATIGGSLRLASAVIDTSGDPTVRDGRGRNGPSRAMYLDGTRIEANLDARGIRVTGEWRMLDLSVRGNVRLDGAVLTNPDRDVWVARRCRVGGNLECRDAEVDGSIVMQEINIGANLDLRASRLGRPGRYTRDRNIKPCLDLRAGHIGRDVICAMGKRPFRADGEIRMVRATIGRQLNFNGADLGAEGEGRSALNAFGAQIQELTLTLGAPPRGRVTLRQARCASLDDNESLWQATGGLDLDAFRYDSLTRPIDLADDAAVDRRLRWLRQAERDVYRPGPYDQLAAMLREAGNEEHADTVLIEKQLRRYVALARGFRVLGALVLSWSWMQRWMVGYGYRPSRAIGWLALLLVAGTAWFAWYPSHCGALPGDPGNFTQYKFCPMTNQDDHLVWNPFLYTLDLLIPIVDFGNKNRWAVAGVSQWFAAGLTAGGWVLATTVAAGLTRLLRRP